MNRLLQICMLLCAISFSATTIAVKNVKSTVLADQEKESLGNYITAELMKVSGDDKVMAWSDVAEMLTHLGQTEQIASLTTDTDSAECLSDKCFAELGGALGIDKILVTDIGEFGSTLVVNMRIIDLSRAESKLRSSKVVKNGVEGVLSAIPELLNGLGYSESAEDLEQKRQDELRLEQLQKDNLARAKAKGLMRQKAAKLEAERKAKLEKDRLEKERVEKVLIERERARKQKLASEAAEKSTIDEKQTRADELRPIVRYGGLIVAILGAGIIGSNSDKISEATAEADKAVISGNESAYADAAADVEKATTGKNFGMGVLGLGTLSFIVSFGF